MKQIACYTFVRMNVYALLSLLFCLVLFPTTGRAQLYQWTDDRGNLHITDSPPPAPEKKPASRAEAAPPVSRSDPSAPQRKAPAKRWPSVGQAQMEPNSTPASQPTHDARNHSLLGGLNPSQATATSPWQIFEGNPASTKAAVQRWKDERGIDHFVDAVPDARRSPGSS